MKGLTRGGLVAVALLLAAGSASAEEYAVEVTASTLNVRATPGGTVRGQVHDGQAFVVSDRRGDWLQISWSGASAWISGSYVRRAPQPAVRVTTTLNARSGPSTSNAVLGIGHTGQAYVLLESSGAWRRVQFDHRRAWMHGDYLLPALGGASAPPPPSPPAPGLAGRLAGAMDHARAELAMGVRESGGANRGPRVDLYARTAGMGVGGEWCGYFASFCYTQAAKDAGVEFAGRQQLHSVQKARAWFLYRSYTQDWTSARLAAWERTRATHRAQGATRRFMTLRGSPGDTFASSAGLPHDVFGSFQQLPLVPGDYVLWPGHMGLVESWNATTGRLVTIEGNTGNRVARRTYDLSVASVRGNFVGFGRPAPGDFE